MSIISRNYESFWKLFIRPPRQDYLFQDLGPRNSLVKGVPVVRRDFLVRNDRGHALQCSHYEIFDVKENKIRRTPCLIYLHCNTGSRVEGASLLEHLAPLGISLCCFDFSGCGLSEGEYISLGWYEASDCEAVIKSLQTNAAVSEISVWGRSMGAVTALYVAAKHPEIKSVVADSAFCDLKRLAIELGQSKTKMPGFLIKGALAIISGTIEKKAKFDFAKLKLRDVVKKCRPSVLFVASKEDSFVSFSHTVELHKFYYGQKRILEIAGNHNSPRSLFDLNSISEFVFKHFQKLGEPKAVIKPISKSISKSIPFKDEKSFEIETHDLDCSISFQEHHRNNELAAKKGSHAARMNDLFEQLLEEAKNDVFQDFQTISTKPNLRSESTPPRQTSNAAGDSPINSPMNKLLDFTVSPRLAFEPTYLKEINFNLEKNPWGDSREPQSANTSVTTYLPSTYREAEKPSSHSMLHSESISSLLSCRNYSPLRTPPRLGRSFLAAEAELNKKSCSTKENKVVSMSRDLGYSSKTAEMPGGTKSVSKTGASSASTRLNFKSNLTKGLNNMKVVHSEKKEPPRGSNSQSIEVLSSKEGMNLKEVLMEYKAYALMRELNL